MAEDWELVERAGLLLARCGALREIGGIAHAFSTRRASGRDDFDLGPSGPVAEKVRLRRSRFLEAAGLGKAKPLILRQVHGARVVVTGAATEGAEADGALWMARDGGLVVPAVRTADCVPILLVDRRGRAAAALHAGWKGTAAGIAALGVQALAERGVEPRDLEAALGPAILSCCYEVGREVWGRVASTCGGAEGLGGPSSHSDRFRLDLHVANQTQLKRAGLDPSSIHAAPWCTHCRPDLFFSHRRDGRAAGRLMAVVGGFRSP